MRFPTKLIVMHNQLGKQVAIKDGKIWELIRLSDRWLTKLITEKFRPLLNSKNSLDSKDLNSLPLLIQDYNGQTVIQLKKSEIKLIVEAVGHLVNLIFSFFLLIKK